MCFIHMNKVISRLTINKGPRRSALNNCFHKLESLLLCLHGLLHGLITLRILNDPTQAYSSPSSFWIIASNWHAIGQFEGNVVHRKENNHRTFWLGDHLFHYLMRSFEHYQSLGCQLLWIHSWIVSISPPPLSKFSYQGSRDFKGSFRKKSPKCLAFMIGRKVFHSLSL